MPNLVFDRGYKEYTINGDDTKTIKIYTSDWNVLDRLSKVRDSIAGKVKELGDLPENSGFDETMEKLSSVEREVRAELDKAFGTPVCENVFGDMNCLSFAGGQPVVLNFLEAIIPEIRKGFEEEQKKADAKLSKYTAAAKQYK